MISKTGRTGTYPSKEKLEAIDLKKNFGGGWFQLGIAEYCNATGNKNNAINHFDRARNDRQWRKMAEYEIDRVRNPEKYE